MTLPKMGIVLLHKKLVWSWDKGFGRTWLPEALKDRIVVAWNAVACRLWGHYWYTEMPDVPDGSRICVDCERREAWHD